MAEEKKEQKEAQAAEAVAIEPSEFDKLLKKEFKPKTDHAREAIGSAVRTLAEQALADTTLVSDDSVNTIEAIIAEIDKKLSEQINMIMHHEDFKSLEGSWRGLHHLVKKDLAKTIKKYKGTAWDQSPLFKKLYEEEYGSPGGEPYGCLVGDYYFDHSPPDVEILNGIAQISAASHSPFISAANPTLMNMDSWQELSNPRDLTKIFQTADYAPWRSLRDSDDSRYIALTMPRFLGRLPYGAKTNPCEEFDFEEDTGGGDHSKYLWVNAAYAMGTNINRSFKEFGWCARIRGVESGGMVEGLPCHTFPTDDGGVDMKCPTEIGITDRREAELAKNGLMPLSHWKNEDYACFIGAQSLQKPTEYDDPDATANAKLAARLPYLFATCRFAHFLKCIVRDKIGSFKERDDMATWLNKWVTQYVTSDPNASEEVKAQYPLAAAEVIVDEVEGDPGYYSAKFFLRPHYQLEGLSVSLRLVSKLPSVKKGG
jgi:type VI secretion system protein ImpC